MADSDSPHPAPGWYPHPHGGDLRWWDGEHWKDDAHPAPEQTSDEQPQSPQSHPATAPAMPAGGLRPDIAQAKARMRVKLGGGREIKRLERHLHGGETVEQMTTGAYGKGHGLVVLTDRRLLFMHEGVMSKSSEDFPIEKVSSVSWSSGMVFGTIIIFASGNKSEIGSVQKDDGKEIVDKIRHRLSSPSPAAHAAPAQEAVAVADPIEQLKKLGELRDAGVVTEEEFEQKKSDLLRRM